MSRLPAVRDALLHLDPQAIPMPVGTPPWFAWLDEAQSFTFAGEMGIFTARQEDRSGRHFWYGYRRRNGTLQKTYLGRSAELTQERLEQAARTLAEHRMHDEARDSSAFPLIATKIIVPQPGMTLVARPAVVARCLESLHLPCTLIAAPAGFGKTTLLVVASEQLKERGWAVAWVSLEEAECDPVRFWMYALAALDGAQPGMSAIAQRMLETPRPPPIENMLAMLINALAAATQPIVLMLDDYHRAATPAIDHSLTFLIEHAPAMLRLVIATRTDPAIPLARLRAQGRIAEIHSGDLRFSTEEAGRFMRETMHITLSADRLAQLEAQTEGWVAGLQLAALSLRDQTGTPELPTDSAAPARYIAEYLIEEVLERQPDEMQTFLLQTSMLERLTGPLCDAVTGRADSAAILTRLMQTQLFVTPLDPGQHWYRYHHLFAEVLRERHQRLAPDTMKQCHRRAAEWLRQQGLVGEAIQHLIAAGAASDAAILIAGESDRLVLHGEIAGLVTWGRALPRASLLAHPRLCVLFTAGLLLQGAGAEATAWLDDLEQSLAAVPCAAQTKGEIAVIRAILSFAAGNVINGTAIAREALRLLAPEDRLFRGLALWVTSIMGLFGEEDLFEISRLITEVAEESLQVGNILVAFMALATRANIEVYQARLHHATQTCYEALRLLPRTGDQESPIAAMAHCLLGEIRREWNDLDGAESILRRTLTIGMQMNWGEFLVDGYISLGMLQAEQGRGAEALATFEELRYHIQAQHLAKWDIQQLEYMRVRALIMLGQIDEVARWADTCRRNRQPHDPGANEPGLTVSQLLILIEMEDFSLARVALAQGRAAEVIAPLELICVHAANGGRLRNVLEAQLLLARARWVAGELEAALRDLDLVLARAAPEGFVRTFLDEGEMMADLLAAYAANRPPSRERAYALTLLAAFGRTVEPSAYPQPALLSPREIDVLRLLATGRSNEAIASDLVVALSTVKWHVAHIYRKLGVTGRVQAIARAREIHLIT